MRREGDLSKTSLAMVMRSIADNRKTGVLDVTDGTTVAMFFFENGRICGVESDQVEESLGRRLLKSGWIDEEQLEEAFRLGESQPGKKALSEVLARMGVVHPPVLRSHVVEQLEEVISTMLIWTEGSYVFDPFPRSASEKSTLTIDVGRVLMGALRRLDQADHLERILPPKGVVLTPRKRRHEREGYLNADEREVLFIVDGTHSIQEVVDKRGGDPVSTLRALSVLYVGGDIVTEGEGEAAEVEEEPTREEHVDMGIAFLEMKMYEEAVREFTFALENNPDSVEAEFYLGLGCYKLNRYGEAVEHLLKSSEVEPVKSAVLNNLGLALEKLGDLDSALIFYTRASEAEDAGSVPWINLGILCYRMELYEEAEKALRLAMEMDSGSSLCPYYLGMILARRGEYDEATKMFKDLIEANPNSAALHNNLAAVHELKGDFEKAEEEYRTAVSIDPNYEKAKENLKAFGE